MFILVKSRRVILSLLVIIALIFLATPLARADNPKSIVLFIGDGMASNHRTITERVFGKKLYMNTLPITGIYSTDAANTIVTDSAASATAMATGQKVNTEYVSTDRRGKIAYETIAEAARRLGKSVGILTTTRLTHATPACFGAHARNRYYIKKIADQYLEQDFEVWMGGGRRDFIPKSKENRQEEDKNISSKRSDERDLLKEFSQKGYTIIRTKAELMALNIGEDTKVFAAFTQSHMPYELDRKEDLPSLAEMTAVALKILSQNPKGFFLMVEGGKIDHASHANAPATVVHQVLALDRAVKAGLDFLSRHPDTLILVGGDHETGGMSMGYGGFKGDKWGGYFMRPDQLLNVKHSQDWLAFKSYRMARRDPAKAVELIKETLGISDFTEEELKKLLDAAELTKREGKKARTPNMTYMPYWLGFTYLKILSDRARVGWTSYSHTGHPILITAAGPGSEKFSGFYHNTEIAKKMAALWGITLGSKPIVKKPRKK